MRKLYLQAFILGITIINPLSAEATTEALSAWEKWLARPSADAAQQVREIEYGSNSRQAIDPDMRLTRDLKLLEKRLSQEKNGALEIAIRLTASTEPGDVLESLHEMLGRAAASRPRHFLQALLQENQGRSCPGVNFLGERFVDDFKAQKAEIARRKSKLRDVKAPHLKDIRDLCLKTLG